jgi:hypothetical protein
LTPKLGDTFADIGKVARLRLLIHAVNIPPGDAAPFSEEGSDEGALFAGNAEDGAFICRHENGFHGIAWCDGGVVALLSDRGEPDRPALEVLAEIERRAPVLASAVARLRTFFGLVDVIDLVTAAYWATSELSSHTSHLSVGEGRPLEWYGRTVEEAKAWVRSEACTFRRAPAPLTDLACWLYDVSVDRRHAFTEVEHMEWQRRTDGELRAVSDLSDVRARLASVGIDWRETTAMSTVLEPPSPIDRASVGDLEVALHEAVALGDVSHVESLLDEGADPNAKGWFGQLGLPGCRPLTVAKVRGGAPVLLTLLARGASPLSEWTDEYIRWLATADTTVGPAVLLAAVNEVPSFLNRPSRWRR